MRDGTGLSPARQVTLEADEAATLPEAEGDAIVMVRPEHLTLDLSSGDVPCRVLRVQLLGGLIRYIVQSDASPVDIRVETTRTVSGIGEGTGAHLTIPPADAVLYHR